MTIRYLDNIPTGSEHWKKIFSSKLPFVPLRGERKPLTPYKYQGYSRKLKRGNVFLIPDSHQNL